MEPTVIREEVQTFLQACQQFAGFAQDNRLTTAEREAIANVIRTGLNLKPSSPDDPDDPPLAAILSNMPLID